MAPVPEYEDENGAEASIMTFETANSTRSTRDSILGLYDRTSYQDFCSTSDTSSMTAYEKKDDDSRISGLVEDYLSQTTCSPDDQDLIEHESEIETGRPSLHDFKVIFYLLANHN